MPVAITTIRLHQHTKAELDRLRGRLIEAEGVPLSAEDTIVRLLRLAEQHEAELLGRRVRAGADAVERWLAIMNEGIRDWGVESGASSLDRDLHGA